MKSVLFAFEGFKLFKTNSDKEEGEMSDNEDSPLQPRSRSRGVKQKRSRSRSKSDRSRGSEDHSRSRSQSYGKRKVYRSRSRSQSPRYGKRKSRYEESPDSMEGGRAGRYKRERNFSVNEDLSLSRNSQGHMTGRDSSPEEGSWSVTTPQCDHPQPFNPNCRACLSDKRHRSILARYNKKIKKFKHHTLLDIESRGQWHPLKRCSRSHSREYQLICRTCKRLGTLCLYPAWAYEAKHPPGSNPEDDDDVDDAGNSGAILITAADMHDTMRDVVVLREGAESVFYEFPINRRAGKKNPTCDCDDCLLSDKEPPTAATSPTSPPAGESKGHGHTGQSYRQERRQSYGGEDGRGREPKRRWSTEEYEREYRPQRKRDYSPAYDYRYERNDSYYEDEGYDSYKNHYDREYRRRDTDGYQYRGRRPYRRPSRGRPTYERGRGGRGTGRGQAPWRGGVTYDTRKRYRQDQTDRYTSSRENPSTSRCIGVFGLSPYTEERDLTKVFGHYGSIDNIQMVYDHQTGKSRGFAFIYFRSLMDAIDAKDSATGIEIDGHKVRVDFSITERAHTPTPGVYLGKPVGRGFGGRRGSQYGRGSHYGRRTPSPVHRKRERYSRSRSYSPRCKKELHAIVEE